MGTRAQITFQNTSGLPEDVIVNTMHFSGPEDSGTDIVDKINVFYNGTPAGEPAPVCRYFGPQVSRVAGSMKIELYNLDDPEPRVAYQTWTGAPADAGSTEGLPSEVALCVSWQAAVVSGVPAGRRRGRNYLGPLGINAVSATEPPRPVQALLDVIAASGSVLINEVDAHPLAIYSTAGVTPVFYDVVTGYVDNAFDTMRSRGEKTTSRETFS